MKCPRCGYEFPKPEEEIKAFNNAVDAAVNKQIQEVKKVAILEAESKAKEEIANLQKQITILENKLNIEQKDKNLAVQQAQNKSNETINKLNADLKLASTERELAVSKALKDANEKYSNEIIALREQIQYYKNFKQSLSTKMIGESLERYCSNEFNKIRSATFPNAYFGKDNDIKIDDEKADFMYRDFTDDKVEYISAMIEMKHEADDTKNKQKIDSFFDKLDRDRKAKNCEYAILVTTLEADNDLYNGITDVSYVYPKMYVVRPQCFISMLTLLKTAALKTVDGKRALEVYKQQNIDITNFENEWDNWKKGFKYNVDLAGKQYRDAIDHINDSIKKLTKARDELESSLKQLGHANDKVDDVTIKRLAKNSPSIKEKLKKDDK